MEALIDALDRADRKGYLPDVLVEEWEAFEFEAVETSDLEALLADVTAIDTWHRGSPSYEHDAGWFKDRVIVLIEKRIAAGASERADAAKEQP